MDTSVIVQIISDLGQRINKNESLKNFFSDFTDATVNWIRPLFLKDDGEPKEIIVKFKSNPKSQIKQDLLKAFLLSEIEDHPEAEKYLIEIYNKLKNGTTDPKVVNNFIIDSQNINTGNIEAGKDVNMGDAPKLDDSENQ